MQDQNQESVFIVKGLEGEVSDTNPFFKCRTHSSENVESKFDFTDAAHCSPCLPILLPEEKLETNDPKPVLKSRKDKDIAT